MGLSEEEWKAAMLRAVERFTKDESLKALIKRHGDMVKRAQKIEEAISMRRNKITMTA